MMSIRRTFHTLLLDLRMQYRNGFYLVVAIALVVSLVLLSQLPAKAVALIFPILIFSNVIISTYLFMGGLILFERNQMVPDALKVTPISPHNYLIAKVGTLTLLTFAEGSLIILFARYVVGISINVINLLTGLLLVSVVFCEAGFIAVSRFGDFNAYFSKGIFPGIVLNLPYLQFFIDSQLLRMVFFAFPTNPSLSIMSHSGTITYNWILNFGLSLVWILALYRFCLKYYEIYFEQRRRVD